MALLRVRRLTYGHIFVAAGDRPQPTAIGNADVYTCPAGNRAIVRDMRFTQHNGTAVDSVVTVSVYPSGASGVYVGNYYLKVGATSIVDKGGHLVLEPGDILHLSCQVNLAYYISGAQMAITA